MRPTDIAVNEHVSQIGPWGWLGWVLFAVAMGAFGMLWKSSGPTELRRLNKALHDARLLIHDMEDREKAMFRRNQDLDAKHKELHEKHLELSGRFSELTAAHGTLGGLIADLRQELKEERDKRDAQFQELMRAKAKTGDL